MAHQTPVSPEVPLQALTVVHLPSKLAQTRVVERGVQYARTRLVAEDKKRA